MISQNEVHLAGWLVNDAVVGYTKDNREVAIFTMVTYRDNDREKREYHRVISLRNASEIGILKSGEGVHVWGTLHTRTYTTKDGIEKAVTEIIAHNVTMEM